MTKSRLLVALLAIAMVFSFSTAAFAEAPALIVTGTGLVDGATAEDLGENAINEIAYSLDELKAINTEEHLYSATNSTGKQTIYNAQGIAISLLLQQSGYNGGGEITLVADDRETVINLDEQRFYFSSEGQVVAPALLAWAQAKSTDGTEPTELEDIGYLKGFIGQTTADDINEKNFAKYVVKIVVGEELTAKVFNANGTMMTRAEVMALGHDEASYTFTNQKGEVTETVKGVYLADLLGDSIADDAVLSFTTADEWDGIAEYDITYAEAKANKYMLAYEKEKNKKGWQGIYNVADNGAGGYFVLYGEGIKPAKFVDGVSAALPAPVAPPAAEGKTIVLTIGSKTAVINGAEVAMDVMPEVVTVNGGGVTFVPVRFVTEQLGLVNNWDAAAPLDVNLVGEGFAGKITIGSVNATINGEAKTLLAAPFATEGRTMVPLRFLSENLGYSVNYDAATQTITIK